MRSEFALRISLLGLGYGPQQSNVAFHKFYTNTLKALRMRDHEEKLPVKQRRE